MLFLIGFYFGLIIFLYKKYAETIQQFIASYQFAKTIPGPPFREILSKSSKNILQWYPELKQRYGPIFRVWYGKDLIVVPTDLEDIKFILSSNQLITKSISYNIMRPWLGNGLLLNGGTSWHQRRKLLTPAFHFKILSSFKDSMEQKCDILIERLEKIGEDKTFDIFPFITLFALDAISETAMGVKKQVQLKENSDFTVATKKLLSVLYQQNLSFWNRFAFFHKFSENKRERDALLSILHKETQDTIADRRELLKQNNLNNVKDAEQNDLGIKRRLAFLDILLLSQMDGADISDLDIREEVDTFMFEGHDTTSSTLSFAIHFLAMHPTVQAKAYQECCEMAGNESETMKYLEAVIKETLRLCPAVPFFSREVTEPIEIGGRLYPTGTGILINAYLIHRNADIYEEPDHFKPDRFLDNREYHPYAFIGFSAGPRNCIGQKFAMLELKTTLAKLIRTFEFRQPAGYKAQYMTEFIMKSVNGIQVQLKKRA